MSNDVNSSDRLDVDSYRAEYGRNTVSLTLIVNGAIAVDVREFLHNNRIKPSYYASLYRCGLTMNDDNFSAQFFHVTLRGCDVAHPWKITVMH